MGKINFVKSKLKDAEKTKKYLVNNNLFNHEYFVIKEKEFIFFPVKNIKKIFKKYIIVKKTAKKRKLKQTNLRQVLKNKLNKQELKHLKTAFDSAGEIAILEIDKDLVKKQKLIAETLLKINQHIKTVLKKSGIHYGEFRLQKMKWLAGRKIKVAVHKENNVILKFNVEKVYFSVRLSNERKRIAELVKPNEEILVMFSGCAPYPCVISKNTDAKQIIGIEINPTAHKYALENVKLNKLKNIQLYCGDVREIIPKIKEQHKKFDRILMPLPKSAEDFLDIALSVAKKGTIIHFYDFLREDKFKLAHNKIKRACKRAGLKCRIMRTVKCGQHAPYEFRICIDFKIV